MSDPGWISFFAIMENGLDEGTLQHNLSFGLQHVLHFFASTTPKSQRELLSSLEQDSNVTFLTARLMGSSFPPCSERSITPSPTNVPIWHWGFRSALTSRPIPSTARRSSA